MIIYDGDQDSGSKAVKNHGTPGYCSPVPDDSDRYPRQLRGRLVSTRSTDS